MIVLDVVDGERLIDALARSGWRLVKKFCVLLEGFVAIWSELKKLILMSL